ncbi:MAG: sodium:proton antiporter NhaD [Paludibacteraceae bacterium]|nr:sodium:proton antiporter NhaD [Paludibacteraceae bacterium]
MLVLMVALFVLGYACIALEHPLKVDKSASALILCAVLWTLYIFHAEALLPSLESMDLEQAKALFPSFAEFQEFVAEKFADGNVEAKEKVIAFVTEVQIVEHLGDVAQTLFYLIGAMTIVELIDVHGGFTIITDKITERSKRKLLWIVCVITFFMSAILDNLTTAIVMTMLLRKLVFDQHERWIYAGCIIIAANSGGAFSPIGDVTTIMLWVKGLVTTGGLLPNLIVPSLLAMIVPVYLASFMLKGQLEGGVKTNSASEKQTATLRPSDIVTEAERRHLLEYGVAALLFVPIFKSITHLPPFIGVLFGLGALWVYTEIMYHRKKDVPDSAKARITRCLGRIDFATILFFLGILMAVATLQCSGILQSLAAWLQETLPNVYVIDFVIGVLSSIVDNVPLVAGCMGMYDIPTAAQLAADPSLADFTRDGVFWMFLAYCAGVGGSLLIIGSAAGVVVMGLEHINFMWYVKKFTLVAFAGYAAGAIFYILQEMFIVPLFG